LTPLPIDAGGGGRVLVVFAIEHLFEVDACVCAEVSAVWCVWWEGIGGVVVWWVPPTPALPL